MRTPVYFVIGTRAQFIKVAPVMRKMLDKELNYTLIYTAQHQENIEEILRVFNLPSPDIVMYSQGEAKTRSSFLRWFIFILIQVSFRAKHYLPTPGLVLTHGDTFTTWLAAIMGKRANCTVGHLESGFRSFNILSPFPEELSRLITFRFADIYFCADDWAMNNLTKYKGIKVNIGANTMLGGVRYALMQKPKDKFGFQKAPYVIVSIHRYENIFTRRLTKVILPLLMKIANLHQLVITLHPVTRERLRKLGVYESLERHTNIALIERLNFVDWIHVCKQAYFVITDGGSNQEELSYLGIPTLLFRYETERREGLGENVVLSKFDKRKIDEFVSDPVKYRRNPLAVDCFPSEKIVVFISEWLR